MSLEVKFGNQQKVYVTYVATNCTFFVQLDTNEAYALNELSQKISSHIESGGRKKLAPDFGIQCYAFSNADQMWYRALISKVSGSKVTVFYIDYGNTEVVPVENLSLPTGSFFENPYQAVCCTLGDFSPFPDEATTLLTDALSALLLEQEFSSVFQSHSSSQKHPFLSVLPCYNVYLFQDGNPASSIATSLVEQGVGQYRICSENIEIGSKQNVYTCFVDSPGKFWIQLSSKVDFLQSVMDDLNAPGTISSLKRLPLSALVPGVACCTQFSEDGRYYRAEIVKVSSSRIEVCFVDYGNCEIVEQLAVFQIPVHMAQSPFCAIQCCLEGVQPIKQTKPDPKLGSIAWTAKACDKLMELTEDRELEANFVADISAEIFSVHLTDVETQANIGEKLAEARAAEYTAPNPSMLIPSKDFRYLTLDVGEMYKNVFISFTESPAVVWCQRHEYSTELSELAASLAEKGPAMPVIQNPIVDQTCCVQYELDHSWCRGVVQSVDQALGTAQVFFVDYGNTETINLSEIRSLQPEFYTLPAQAISFSMAEITPRGGEMWNTAAIESFQGLVYEQSLHVKVVGLDQDGYPSAKLIDPLNGNMDIGLELVRQGFAKVPWNSSVQSGNEKTSGRNEAIRLAAQLTSSPPQPSFHSGKESDSSSTHSQNFRSRSNEKKISSSPRHSKQQSPHQRDRHQSKKTSSYQSRRESPYHSPNESPFHSQKQSSRDSSPSSQLKYQLIKLDEGQAYDVSVCHVEMLTEFYCHLSSETTKLNELMRKIHDHCNSRNVRKMKYPKIEMPVLALFSEDRVWYRARICGKPNQNGSLPVVFADYGNTETVSQNGVAQMPPFLLSLPAQAIQCSLFGVPSGMKQSEKAINAFGELTIEQDFQLVVKQSSKDVPVVELLSPDNSSVLDHLIKNGYLPHTPTKGQSNKKASPETASVPLPHVPLQEHLDVVPSFIESPARFCVQLTDTYTGLEKLSNELNEFYQQLPAQEKTISQPEPDQFCAMRFIEDGLWYRARITQVFGPQQKCEVCYIDYGNSETVNTVDLKVLVPEFTKLPCFGISCSLDGLPASSAESPAVIGKFLELVTDKQLVAQLKKSSSTYGEFVPVKLTDTSTSGRDVDIVQALMEGGQESKQNITGFQIPSITPVMNSPMECQVTFVNSPGDFYLQLVSESEHVTSLMNKMYAFYEEQNEGSPLSSPLVGSYCAALYSDESWYRGKITSLTSQGAMVFYLDFGNTDEVVPANLRVLDPQFISMPTQALKCSVNNVVPLSINWSDDCNSVFSDLILEKTLQVSFLKQDAGGSYETRLLHMGEDVALKLCEIGVAQKQDQGGTDTSTSSLTVPPFSVKTGVKYDAFVTSVISPLEFYCQLVDPDEKLDLLMTEIDEHCRNTRPSTLGPMESYSWKPGDFALALFSQDETWYRAVVTKVLKGGIIVEVHYVDYGNNEMVSQSQLLPIKREFCALPSQAVKCCLEGSQHCTYNKESLDQISELLLDQEFVLKCVSVSSDGTRGVDLNRKSDDIDMMSLVIQEKMVTVQKDVLHPFPSSTLTPSSSEGEKKNIIAMFPSDVAPETYHDVTVVHGENPSLFYCQFSLHNAEILESLMSSMQSYYNAGKGQSPAASELKKGLYVAAQYSEDERWYRALVEEVTIEGVRVTFVDYGNSEVVELQLMKHLTSDYSNLPAQAIPCSLADVGPLSESWTDEIIEIFLDLVLEKTLVAQVKSLRNFCNKPYLFGDGQTLAISLIESSEEVASKLAEMGLANNASVLISTTPSFSTDSSSREPSSGSVFKFLNISRGDICEMYVSSIESPSAFWLQMPSAEDTLAPLQDKLMAYGSSKAQILGKPTPGSICCAKFSEDGNWYRGVVKSVLPGGVHVCFMDYGNSEVIPPSDVKVLLPDFFVVPVQAIECKLSNCNPLDGETNWSDDAITTFSGLVSDKLLTVGFVCKMYNTWDVNLFDGEVDIATQLLQKGVAIQFPLQVPVKQEASLPEPVEIPKLDLEVGHTYSAYIAFNDSPSKFYCQLVSECDKLESLMAEIADFYNGNHLEPLLEVGAYCVAQYSGNCAWYRARIMATNDKEDVEVHFIDYGNSEHVSGSQILALGSRFAHLPAQAFCCSLIRSLEMEFPAETMDLFFSYDLNQEFRIKVTALQEDRYVVDLFDQEGSLINATLLKTEDSLTSQPPVPAEPASYIPLTYSIGTNVDVYITFSSSPTSFFCQPLELTAELENMMTELSSVLSAEPPTPLPLAELASGKVCVAQYSLDNEWYRAIVEEIISEKEVLVSFVDYGNSEVMSLEHVAPLPLRFLSTQVQSLHCSVFEGLGVEMEWSEDQVAQFQNLIPENEQHNLKVTGTSKSGQYFVEVTTNGDKKDFAAILEQRFDQPTTHTHSQQPPLRDPFGLAVPADDHPLLKPTSNLSTLALKGSQTPSVGGLESGSENGETEETDASEGKPLIRAPFKLSLAVQEVLEVNVVYTQSPSLLYIQRLDCQNELFTLSDEIQQYCASFDNSAAGHQTFHEGDFVLAKYIVDDTWYRAEVIGVDSDGTAKVHFIDYGNEEVISPENLVMCPENFLELPVQAIPCSLSQVPARDAWPTSYKDFINSLVEEKALRVTVVLPASQGMRPTINLEDLETGVDISQKVLTKLQEECELGSSEVIVELPEGDAELFEEDVPLELTEKEEETKEEVASDVSFEHTAVSEDMLPPQDTSMNLPDREFTVGMTLEVYMIFCSSPHSFVCQLASDSEVLDSITTHLAQLYTYQEDNTAEGKYTMRVPPKEGDLVVGQFSEDNQWYRAKVLAVSEEDFEVQYIDFGNSEHLQLDSMRSIDPSLLSHPPQGVECYLNGIEIPSEEGQFNELAAEKMQELVGEDSCNIEIVSIDTAGHLAVTLTTVSGLNVGSALIENKLASPLVPSVDTTSNLISPEIAPTTVNELAPGDDLEAFHEAEESLPSENTSTVFPEQPSTCDKVDTIEVTKSTSQESVSSEKSETAQVRSQYATSFPQQSLPPESRYQVEVTFVATLDEFMCQLLDHTKEFQDLQDNIASQKYQPVTDDLSITVPEVSMPVCVCSTEDDVWYRAEVISIGREPDTVKVYYVDFGRTEILPLKRVKYLERSFAEALPPLSVKCCLPTLTECDLNPNLQLEGDAWELVWPTTSIRHFSEVTTLIAEASNDGGLYLEIMEITVDGSYLVKVISCTPPEKEKNIRDLLVAKLREPKPLTLDSSRLFKDDSIQSQDGCIDELADDPLASSEALKAAEREFASATPPPTDCVYEVSNENDSLSLGTVAAMPQPTGNGEPTSEQILSEKEPIIADGVKTEGTLPVVCAANESVVLEVNSQEKEGVFFSGDPPQGSTAILNSTLPEQQTQNKESVKLDEDQSDALQIPAAGSIEATLSNTICEEECVKIESGSGLGQDTETVVELTSEKGKCAPTVLESEVLTNGCENDLITEGTGATKSTYDTLQLSIDQELLLLYITGTSPAHFTCQPFESCEQLVAVMDEIKDYVDNEGALCTPLVSVEIGEPVIAQFSEDCQWYRGEVVSFDPESKSAHILFVDYGNSEDVPLTSIYKIPQEKFLHLPKQAVSCSLFGVKPVSDGGSWDSRALEKIEELANGCNFVTVKIVGLDSSLILVKLKSDSCVDFGEELVVCGLAVASC